MLKLKKHTIYFLFAIIVCSARSLYAQQVVSTKGDKLQTSSFIIEPWQVENTINKATANTQNIYQNANVGIGNFASKTLTEKLEVEGNTNTRKAFVTGMVNFNNTNEENYTSVGVNVNTGELVKFTNTSKAKPFSYVVFDITTRSGEDWVKTFDTRISSTEYTVLLVNAVFNFRLNTINDAGVERFSPFNYEARKSGSTWILSADYQDAKPPDGSTYKWRLVCLVIQNSRVQDLGSFTRSLDDNAEGGMTNAAEMGL